MTPQEKAAELFKRFYCFPNNSKHKIGYIQFNTAKQCALIAVDEIIKTLVELSNGEFTFIHNVQYWQEVKQEIENIS